MSKFIKLLIPATLLLLSSAAVAEGVSLVIEEKLTGDLGAFLAVVERATTLDKKLNPKAYPSVRIVRHTLTGGSTGNLTVVVAFDDLEHLARHEAIHQASAEWQALTHDMAKHSQVLSVSVLSEVLFDGPDDTGTGTHLIMGQDVKGDLAGFVQELEKVYALDKKINPDNLPSIRVLQAMFAGKQSGSVNLVVAFKSLEAYAKSETRHATNKEWGAAMGRLTEKYPVLWAGTYTQLVYHAGK